jgi:hypothetical protein
MTQTLIRPGRRQHRGRAATVSLATGGLVLLGLGGTAAAYAAGDGYVSLGAQGTYDTAGYALSTDGTDWHGGLGHLVGTVRIRVAPGPDGRPIFAGVAAPAAVRGYLAGTRYTIVHSGPTRTEHAGSAAPPVAAVPWTVSATGTGTQTLQWPAADDEQVLVVMNADGSAPVRGQVESVAVTIRGLAWIAIGLLLAGALLLAAAAARVRRGRPAAQADWE